MKAGSHASEKPLLLARLTEAVSGAEGIATPNLRPRSTSIGYRTRSQTETQRGKKSIIVEREPLLNDVDYTSKTTAPPLSSDFDNFAEKTMRKILSSDISEPTPESAINSKNTPEQTGTIKGRKNDSMKKGSVPLSKQVLETVSLPTTGSLPLSHTSNRTAESESSTPVSSMAYSTGVSVEAAVALLLPSTSNFSSGTTAAIPYEKQQDKGGPIFEDLNPPSATGGRMKNGRGPNPFRNPPKTREHTIRTI